MRLDLFSRGDTVLLLGEGNFSFSVCLHKHRLPIEITATCFQSELNSERELNNIEYLKTNDVPVFFNVDATNLRDNPNFVDVKFSKIVFNFPHVGGKMKIHLNRELLRKFFLSAGHVLAENGLVLVSLCRGQGGTPADHPQRRWDDTWQIAEMAAHGDFILTDVGPFLKENFQGYDCVGYRSQNVGFHLDDALVHVFAKKPPVEDADRLRLLPLPDTDILTPPICIDLCRRDPILNPDSGISYLRKILMGSLNEPEVEVVETMPLYTDHNQDGIQCEVKSAKYSLRSDPIDIVPILFKLANNVNLKKKLILYLGMYFRNSGAHFFTNAPVDFKFTIFGRNLRSEMIDFLNNLIVLFKERHTVILNRNVLMYRNTETGSEVRAVEFHAFRGVEYCIINSQSICEYLFRVSWRQIWADHKITVDAIPVLKSVLLYPSRYEFDITLRFKKPFLDEDLFRILWLGGGLFIEGVTLLNEYASDKWSSKCYRIAYRSLDRPLYRKRALEIHSILGRLLEARLGVIIG